MTGPTPNIFADFALLVWPIVTLLLCLFLPTRRAILWSIVGAQLTLPVGTILKLEMIPALDKIFVPNLAILLCCWSLAPNHSSFRRSSVLLQLLVAVYVLSPFVTAYFNQDTLALGPTILPPEGYYDALSAAASQLIAIVPFYLGRRYFTGSKASEDTLKVLVISCFVYCAPLLFEIRMSPQLHNFFYGYAPSDFIQTMRAGGYRPMVFLGHPLMAAFYLMVSVVSATALYRMGRKTLVGLPTSWILACLGVVLLLCKSLASIVYAIYLVSSVYFARPKIQLRAAKILLCIALLYPILRIANLFPTSPLIETAQMVSKDRADSLQFRFDHEDRLVDRAHERFWFGWGRFGRNRIYDEETGKDTSVTDGRWVITLGQFGFVGFLAEFGLLSLSVFSVSANLRFISDQRDQIAVTALALILSIFVLNLLPNSSLWPLTWLLAGILSGKSSAVRASTFRRQPKLDVPSAPSLTTSGTRVFQDRLK
jgi:hypothetical protein